MESQHGQRLGAEADRYAALMRDLAKERDATAAEKQAVAEAHDRKVIDLTTGYDAQLQVCRGCKPLLPFFPFCSRQKLLAAFVISLDSKPLDRRSTMRCTNSEVHEESMADLHEEPHAGRWDSSAPN